LEINPLLGESEEDCFQSSELVSSWGKVLIIADSIRRKKE